MENTKEKSCFDKIGRLHFYYKFWLMDVKGGTQYIYAFVINFLGFD
jgi:hypothetical protein